MAKKSTQANDDSSQEKVTRVKAKDDKQPAAKPTKAPRQKLTVNGQAVKPKKKNFLKRFIGYFKGAWFELRQVRWPSRRATWSMTGALLAFTGLFVGFIVVVDLVFENLFKLMLGN